MKKDWFQSFIEGLERIIEKPPYLIFIFIGSILVLVSLFLKSHFEQTWAFLIYAVGGSIWRHMEKDLSGPIMAKFPKKITLESKYLYSDLIIRIIYHVGNLLLIFLFFHYLHFV